MTEERRPSTMIFVYPESLVGLRWLKRNEDQIKLRIGAVIRRNGRRMDYVATDGGQVWFVPRTLIDRIRGLSVDEIHFMFEWPNYEEFALAKSRVMPDGKVFCDDKEILTIGEWRGRKSD